MASFCAPAPLPRAPPRHWQPTHRRRRRRAPRFDAVTSTRAPVPVPAPRRSKLVLTRRAHLFSLRTVRRASPRDASHALRARNASYMPPPPPVSLATPPVQPAHLLAARPPVLTYVLQRAVVGAAAAAPAGSGASRTRRSADPPYRYLKLLYGVITPFAPGYLSASNPRAAGAAALKSWYVHAARWRLLQPAPCAPKLRLSARARLPHVAPPPPSPSSPSSSSSSSPPLAARAAPPHAVERALGLSPRLIVVGDVHGCIDELQALLRLADYSPGDQVIFLGDLVAKGPDSAAVVQLAREIGARMVRGNHDYEVIRCCAAHRRGLHAVVSPEHARIAAALSSHDYKFLSDAPWFIECEHWKHLFVHAGFIPGVKLTQQNPRLMMNMRSVLSDGTVSAKSVLGCEWARLWRGPNTVVFGHDACRGLQQFPFAKGIDTGCVYGGRLTALLLPDNRLLSVAAKRAYVSPKKLRCIRTSA